MTWKLACFDLDGTLARISTGQHLASKIGHAAVMRELEEAYLAGHITNVDVSAGDGLYYRGLDQESVARMLDDIPVIDDIRATVQWLRSRGIASVICTLAWCCVGEVFAKRYGFTGSSGPVLSTDRAGLFTGSVEVDFTEQDKPVFVRQLCESLGVQMAEVFHVGDSVSDIPLFAAVGFSVAFNANQRAREKARVTVDSDSLLDVIDAIPGLGTMPRLD